MKNILRKPLAGKRLVVTRTAVQAGTLARRLRALGATVLEAPAIRIVPPRDRRALDRAAIACVKGGYDWVFLTSANGVRFFGEALERARRRGGRGSSRASAPIAAKIAAVGSETARAARAMGIRPALVPARFSSREMARAFLRREGRRSARVLLLQGNRAPFDLARALRKAGHRVTRVEAYRNLPASRLPARLRRALAQRPVDGAAFASPSAASGFLALAGGAAAARRRVLGWPAFAIGPATAAALKKLGFALVRQARRATAEGLIREIRRVLEGRGR